MRALGELMKVPTNIINSLAEWNNGAGISLSNWILCVGNYDHFIAYSRLVWPELIEYEGRIYIADFFNVENFESNIENRANEYEAQFFPLSKKTMTKKSYYILPAC